MGDETSEEISLGRALNNLHDASMTVRGVFEVLDLAAKCDGLSDDAAMFLVSNRTECMMKLDAVRRHLLAEHEVA